MWMRHIPAHLECTRTTQKKPTRRWINWPWNVAKRFTCGEEGRTPHCEDTQFIVLKSFTKESIAPQLDIAVVRYH